MQLLLKSFLLLVIITAVSCGSSEDPMTAMVEQENIITGSLDFLLSDPSKASFDLNDDGTDDLSFEIINLLDFNNELPDGYDTLAARVIPHHSDILDNSTYGYPDALEKEIPLDESLIWTDSTTPLVLGTFLDAGNFKGQGWKYLGFRLHDGEELKYGWIKLQLSEDNSILNIGEYAYNNTLGESILTGQSE